MIAKKQAQVFQGREDEYATDNFTVSNCFPFYYYTQIDPVQTNKTEMMYCQQDQRQVVY